MPPITIWAASPEVDLVIRLGLTDNHICALTDLNTRISLNDQCLFRWSSEQISVIVIMKVVTLGYYERVPFMISSSE